MIKLIKLLFIYKSLQIVSNEDLVLFVNNLNQAIQFSDALIANITNYISIVEESGLNIDLSTLRILVNTVENYHQILIKYKEIFISNFQVLHQFESFSVMQAMSIRDLMVLNRDMVYEPLIQIVDCIQLINSDIITNLGTIENKTYINEFVVDLFPNIIKPLLDNSELVDKLKMEVLQGYLLENYSEYHLDIVLKGKRELSKVVELIKDVGLDK